MLFAIGTKVRFRFTGDTGTITALLDDGMLEVRLDDDPDIRIPAFEDDLLRHGEPDSPGAKFIAGKPAAKPAPPQPRREVKSQYVILKSKGIQVGFEPLPGRDGSITKFRAWLINDTHEDVLADFQLFVKNDLVLDVEEKLAATTALDAGDILFDDLNDAPEIEFRCQRITTAGLDEAMDKFLKIRPKQFFNHLVTAPILNLPVYLFPLVESFEAKPDAAADDLKSYAKKKVREQREGDHWSSNLVAFQTHNPEEFASFVPEIDLHIQNLVGGYAKMDPSMMLRTQLAHFEKFMEKAIRLGVPSVFVIHGLGEGKLKEEIAYRLRQYPQVRKFKNEFHAKYGYGATEVIFS